VAASGLRVPLDGATRMLRHEVYAFWPSDLLNIFERAGLPRRSPPPFVPGTESELTARSGNPPKIISPAEGDATVLDTSGEIPLRAKTDADVREIYWFAGKSFIGKSHASDILSWKSSRGSYQLIALDDHGRSSSCRVEVR